MWENPQAKRKEFTMGYDMYLTAEECKDLRAYHKARPFTDVLGCDYRAAQFVKSDGTRVLQSFWTNVCAYTPDGMFVKLWEKEYDYDGERLDWSRTTMKHIQGFTGRWIPKRVWLRLPVGVPVDLDEEIKRG